MRNSNSVAGCIGLLIVAACGQAATPAAIVPEVTGRIEDKTILEASGLAPSRRQDNLLWIINDHGAKETVHALDFSGNRLGEFDLKKSKNKDWEDLASFRLEGRPMLMIADIGDNAARRKHRTLYFVEEPTPEDDGEAKREWEVNFSYPGGPRDAEAAAVDSENGRALILSKRDMPAQLYAVPLFKGSGFEENDLADKGKPVVATLLGQITSLDKPSRQDIEYAPKGKDWHWQPVGMDISADSLAAVILTYGAVYYYRREARQDWLEALNSAAVRVDLGNFENAEAISFADDNTTVFVTGENKHSRLLRIDFSGVVAP